MPEALACKRVVMALRSNIDEWVRMAGGVVEMLEPGSAARRELLHLQLNIAQAAETVARLAEQMDEG